MKMTGSKSMRALTLAVICATSAPALAQPVANPVRVTADELYEGWRGTSILARKVTSPEGRELGVVRNLLIADNGQITGLVVAENGNSPDPEFVFRIPWERIAHEQLPGRLVAGGIDSGLPEFGLFGGAFGNSERAAEFTISEIIGDYARLKTGLGYGYVSDAVFNRGGALIAVLVTRDATARGGTYAFGFPGRTGRWNPQASYYGLPFITTEQADGAALRVDPKRFEQAAAR